MNSGFPPAAPNRSWNSTIARSGPIGAKKRAQSRVEEGFYPTWEHLLFLHRLDFWHCRIAQRSQPGWPDYVVLGGGWHAFVELKARRVGGTKGTLDEGQKRYKASIEAAGAEYRTFLLPDEWSAVDDWLIGHTGIEVRGWAQSQKASAMLVSPRDLPPPASKESV